MKDADGFARLFETGQYGRFYIVSAPRAGSAAFRLFVLPPGERAAPSGADDAPLNRDAVEVYDIRDEPPGASEPQGVLSPGNWQQDFAALVEARCAANDAQAVQGRRRFRRGA